MLFPQARKVLLSTRWGKLTPDRNHSVRPPIRSVLGRGNYLDIRLLAAVSPVQQGAEVSRSMTAVSRVAEHGAVRGLLGGAFALFDRRRRRAWLIAALTGPASIILNFVVKTLVRRPQPTCPNLARSVNGRVSYSFPSAHATSSFAAATVLGRVEAQLEMPALALAYSRVHLARHYPTDVAAGALLGLMIGAAVDSRILKAQEFPV